MHRYVSEPNGSPIEVVRDELAWRKFALAIDFARPDEELLIDFGIFLKDAREKNRLEAEKKVDRRSRGGVPSWLNSRYAWDSLNALGAQRLIEAFAGDHRLAYRYQQERLGAGASASTGKELKRAAGRVPSVVEKLFWPGSASGEYIGPQSSGPVRPATISGKSHSLEKCSPFKRIQDLP